MNLYKKASKFLKLRLNRKDDWQYYLTLQSYEFPDEISIETEGVFLRTLNLHLKKGSFAFLLEGYAFARALTQKMGAVFTVAGDRLQIKIAGLVLDVTSSEELFILNEIYIEGCYNFNGSAPQKDLVVIDIGMNVAFASTYFAVSKKASCVYSFAPFGPTYQQAIKNIRQNGLEEVIIPHNFGLGRDTGAHEVDYSPSQRGRVGIWGTKLILDAVRSTQKEKIEIQATGQVTKGILEKHPEASFVLKIDCEGAEYDILPAIEQTGLMNQVKMVMIEWHLHGPDALLDILKRNGFTTFSLSPLADKAGMIYAMK